MNEVVFMHKESKTLILVDLIENITDNTPNTNIIVKIFFKYIFFMWNSPAPAPEYQLGWTNRAAAREVLEKVLTWDFDKVIIAHGDIIESHQNAKDVVIKAWKVPIQMSLFSYVVATLFRSKYFYFTCGIVAAICWSTR